MSPDSLNRERIRAVRAKVYEWIGPTEPVTQLCVSASDVVPHTSSSMSSFSFHAWLTVEIETESGLVGLGNASISPHVTKALIDRHLAPLLIGANPIDIERLWQLMYRRTLPFGRRGVAVIAISALDIALWDLMGKLVGLPVFRLLGGRTREAIPVYASKLYHGPAEARRAEAQRYVDEGFRAVKMRLGHGPADGAEGMRLNEEAVALVRETIGPDVDLMIEVYMGWTLEYARQMLPRLSPYRVRWLEEPVISDDVDGYIDLRSMGQVPIAGGEHEQTIWGFRRLLEGRGLDYIQFDTNRVGGISQARKIIAMAEAYSVPVVPHAGQMHNYHLVMSSLICPMAEYFPPHPVEIGNELFWYLFEGEPVADRGFIDLDDERPGLGYSISDQHLANFNVVE